MPEDIFDFALKPLLFVIGPNTLDRTLSRQHKEQIYLACRSDLIGHTQGQLED